jgi:Spy/CpxP family protein refolding chaperone
MKSFSYVLAALAAIAFALPSIANAEDAKPMAKPMHHHHHHHHHHGMMKKPETEKKM